MRVILIGTPAERARLAVDARASALEIAGEFATLAAARAARLECDAYLLPPDRDRLGDAIEEPLTPRELDVLERLAEGMSNKAIAASLGISDQTVKFHVAALTAKLGARNRTDAVRRGVRRGLIVL